MANSPAPQGYWPALKIRALPRQALRLMTLMDKQRFVNSTRWLRPFTRWATRFSLNSPQWLPGFIRNTPLKLTSLVLRGYHRALR